MVFIFLDKQILNLPDIDTKDEIHFQKLLVFHWKVDLSLNGHIQIYFLNIPLDREI